VKPRPVIVTGVSAAVALLLTVLATVPGLQLAFRSPSLHAAIETAAALAAMLATFLAIGRFVETRARADLALACGLATLALTDMFFAAVPAAVSDAHLSPFATWSSLTGTVLGALMLAAAPYLPSVGRLPTRALVYGLVAVGVLLCVVAGIAAALRDSLPLGVAPALDPRSVDEIQPTGNVVILGGELVAFLAFAAAAIGFTRRARIVGDDLLGWLGAGAAVGAVARVDYFLFPSLYSDWVYTGDALRVAFYGFLLVGAAFEIARYHRRLAAGAMSDERRRIARELHDGLAQELAYIITQAAVIERSGWEERWGAQLTAAAERALDESRAAIAALTDAPEEPLADALARAADEAGTRAGVHIRLELKAEVEVERVGVQALTRIVREAVWNAGRHGHAREVLVELVHERSHVLRIVDDGVGFDPAAYANGNGRKGHGLVSMRERAERLGGEFVLTSAPGRGTTIEIQLP
jgi:signal transduction histidine kinase